MPLVAAEVGVVDGLVAAGPVVEVALAVGKLIEAAVFLNAILGAQGVLVLDLDCLQAGECDGSKGDIQAGYDHLGRVPS